MTLRARLLGTVLCTALAFALLVATSISVTRAVEAPLVRVQREQIPRLELGPQLEADFTALKRAYQDAVAAHDPELLARTAEVRDRLLADLDRGGAVFDPGLVADLRSAVRAYHDAALDVSGRMIAGRGDEETVAAIAQMQAKQAHAQEVLERLSTIDHGELRTGFDEAYEAEHRGARNQLAVMTACLVFLVGLALWNVRSVARSLSRLEDGFSRFGAGELDEPIALEGSDELAALAREANTMAKRLAEAATEREVRDWIRSGLMELSEELRGELDESEVATRAARTLARRADAVAGAVYVRGDGASPVLHLRGRHALAVGPEPGKAAASFAVGEGLIGEAARGTEIVVVADVPPDFLHVRSGLGESAPAALVLVPFVLDGTVRGVLELASFKPISPSVRELLTAARETVAIALAVAQSRAATDHLLDQTQKQAALLLEQEEELRSTNEELRCQQEELRQTNDEIAEQRTILESRNAELLEAGRRLEQKAAELATVSAYKSQFLANMSHELRTPLNSMLLLSKLLEENGEGNLTAKQTEYARTVHGAGRDLLLLINQVLDLAKVESGKQSVEMERFPIADVADQMRRRFEALATEKGLRFEVETANDSPRDIATDRQRLAQILTNLIGNAIKFTEEGTVKLRVARSGERVAFAVHDTGPGIPVEHQARVFHPFEQVDGSTQRKHGGTGLGLGIAREFAILLGGELRLESNPGRGSTFTCLLPAASAAAATRTVEERVPPAERESPSDLDLLVIEDDPVFAEVLGDVIGGRGLAHATARDGTTGLRIARERRPRGIILDVKLPDMDGWTVMEKLRQDPRTSGIPVHFTSGIEHPERGLALGAIGYLVKPASAPDLARMVERLGRPAELSGKKVLVIGGEAALAAELNAIGIATRTVAGADEALLALEHEAFACIVVDLDIAETSDLGLLDRLEARSTARGREMPGLVVYTSRPLSRAETTRIERYAEAVILKEGASKDRLIDEIRLFVRRLENGTPPRAAAPKERSPDVKLADRKLLVVDDDMRTVYALSAMLRARGANVLVAETGASALDVLAENPDVSAVLMDVMMPEMDGYEATRRIRAQSRFAALPIIALTAKAMKGDEQRCLDAGATEYLAKPIDASALLSTLGRLLVAAAS